MREESLTDSESSADGDARGKTRLKNIYEAIEKIFYESASERAESRRALALGQRKLDRELEKYERIYEKDVSEALRRWTFPFAPSSNFFKRWINEKITYAPAVLGGRDYDKFIKVFENSGFEGLEKFLEGKFATPFMIAQAYTALARKLMFADRKKEALLAAEKAYFAEPKAFRGKWLAFRQAEAGDFIAAKDTLLCLDAETSFSPSEKKTRANIIASGALEQEVGAYRDACEKILGAACEEEMEKLNQIRSEATTKTEAARDSINFLDASILIPDGIKAALALYAAMSGRGDEEILCDYAATKSPRPQNLRVAYWIARENGRAILASEIMERCAKSYSHLSSDEELDFLEYLLSEPTYQLGVVQEASKLPRGAQREYAKGRICYVLHNSLPYSSGGYATRGAGVASGLGVAGYEVIAVTRPGYLIDSRIKFDPTALDPDGTVINGTRYIHIPRPAHKGRSARDYAILASIELKKIFERYKPEIVIAASNHATGLPSFIAARQLGIPFIYEVRGLWEITHMSRDPKFEKTSDFLVNKIIETELCKLADHVFTLTAGLKNELEARGVPAESISIAPNACDPELFKPAPKNKSLLKKLKIPANAPVIGYIGTITDYEGLEDLARACAALKAEGREFRLLLVGSENASRQQRGPIAAEIERIAREGNFADWLIMPGRVPHEEVGAYYSLIDIAPFPRKPWPVCRIVSPMKPIEALAMEKAVLVSNVEALVEMILPGETGLVFESGNSVDLAKKLAELLDDPERRQRLGREGRKFIINNRSWDRVIADMTTRIEKVSKEAD